MSLFVKTLIWRPDIWR